MGFREWWNRLGEEETYEDYKEEFYEEESQLMVRVFDIKGESDAEELLEAIDTGKVIALINSKNIKDNGELKNIILRVKEVTEAKEGRVVGLPDKWFLVTPKEVGIYKKQEQI